MEAEKAQKREEEEECIKVGLSREDAFCGLKWTDGVNQIATAAMYRKHEYIALSKCKINVLNLMHSGTISWRQNKNKQQKKTQNNPSAGKYTNTSEKTETTP